jgi:hypothetical protein
VIASIEGPATIERILAHLGCDGESVDPAHASRAPPMEVRHCSDIGTASLCFVGRLATDANFLAL